MKPRPLDEDHRETVPLSHTPPASTMITETHHRIANNLSLIAALVRLQATNLSRRPQAMMTADAVCLLLQEITERIEAVARLHALLAHTPHGSALELSDYLRDIAVSVVSSLAVAERALLSHGSTAGCLVTPDQALSIGLIVTEMLTNSLKYAHPTGVAAKINVSCQRENDRMIAVEIADDGVGLPEGFDPTVDGGLGLHVVRSLAQQLGARLVFDHHSLGLRFRLLIPAQPGGDLSRAETPFALVSSNLTH